VTLGQAEINDPNARILVVGRDHGREEERAGRPFVGPSGGLLNQCLAQAGLSRQEVNVSNVLNKKPPGNRFGAHARGDVDRGIGELHKLVRRLQPNLVVTLGNEASFCFVDSWPSKGDSIYSASGIEDRRGYIWQAREEFGGVKVLTAIHPAAALRQWVPWTTLLTRDLERAKRESRTPSIQRPERRVTVVASKEDARRHVDRLRDYRKLSFDIEIDGEGRLLCVGFAGTSEDAVVFPTVYLDGIRSILEKPFPRKLAANGQFDIHFLRTRNGIRVKGYRDDTQVAWHSCYPQLAGKQDGSSAQTTKKSVAFLASLFTTDAWWKDYDTDEMGMYELCGRDCCIEFDIMGQLDKLVDSLDCRRIYHYAMSLVAPCVDAQERGILVDEPLRKERLEQLDDRIDTIGAELNQLVDPILEENRDHERFKLFEDKWTCPCCRNGRLKRVECWSCAGFDRRPNKKSLGHTKLDVCRVCDGMGQRIATVFNPNSHDQVKILLYEFLKLPPRYSDGKLSGTTEKIRGLLANV